MTTKFLSAYDQAVRYLGVKMHSRADLETKLLRKGHDSTEVRQVLSQLEEEGFIDDAKYAEIFLKNLMTYKTFGYYGIRNKLLQKKINKSLVDSLLRKELSLHKEGEIARRFVQKPNQMGRSKKSLALALRQKGFRTEIIVQILNSNI